MVRKKGIKKEERKRRGNGTKQPGMKETVKQADRLD
jgi:hypothetical protein